MDRFVGRAEDLDFLEDHYNNPSRRAVGLIGRRRIGKTRLIMEFVKNRSHIYFQFLNTSAKSNLQYIELRMSEVFGQPYHFNNSIEFFFELKKAIDGDKYVIVFDEYQFMSSVDDAFSSLLQEFIDHHKGDSMVIISGSYIGMMDDEYRNYSRPLYGRIHRYLLGPLSISECRKFHPAMSDDDQMCMYLTFGGIPMYYDFPETKKYSEFLERYALKENSPLNLEGEGMIRREFSPGDEYESILDSIAAGHNTVPEITNETGLDRSTVNHHIDGMMKLDFIEEIHVMAGCKPRPVRFRIKDRMLAFHYHVLRKYQATDSSFGRTYKRMKQLITTFHGRMFEMQCADYLKQHYPVKEIGVWYGKIPKNDRKGTIVVDGTVKTLTDNTDIDIVAYVRDGENTVELYGECKFRAQLVDIADARLLESRMKFANVGANSRMIFFSRYGFGEKMIEYAEENNAILVELKDMLS